jgi:hypothetical protein
MPQGKRWTVAEGTCLAINCIESLVNIEESYTKIDNAGLHRSEDLGLEPLLPITIG